MSQRENVIFSDFGNVFIRFLNEQIEFALLPHFSHSVMVLMQIVYSTAVQVMILSRLVLQENIVFLLIR